MLGGHAELDEGTREPASADAADGGAVIDDDERQAEVAEIEVESLREIGRQPEQVEPPDGVGEEFADGESPGLAMAQQLDPGSGGAGLLDDSLIDVVEFGSAEGRMFGGLVVLEKPEEDP